MIRDRKIFLEKQSNWNSGTKKTVALLGKNIQARMLKKNAVMKKKSAIVEKAKKSTNLTCVIEEES